MSWPRLTVELSSDARRDVRDLNGPIRVRILRAVARYAETGAGNVKRLQGEDAYRLRVGDYRVIFEIVSGQLAIMFVIRLRHRREVYR